MNLRKNQSAFSLIEVLIALLVLSISVLGASKVLLLTMQYYGQAEFREKATILAWSMTESLRSCTQNTINGAEYWQKKFEEDLPGSKVRIQQTSGQENTCGYKIEISYIRNGMPALEFNLDI